MKKSKDSNDTKNISTTKFEKTTDTIEGFNFICRNEALTFLKKLEQSILSSGIQEIKITIEVKRESQFSFGDFIIEEDKPKEPIKPIMSRAERRRQNGFNTK